MGRAWGRSLTGTGPSLFLCCPKHCKKIDRCFLYLRQLFYQVLLFPHGRELCVDKQKFSLLLPPSFSPSFLTSLPLSPRPSFLPFSFPSLHFSVTVKCFDGHLKSPTGLCRALSPPTSTVSIGPLPAPCEKSLQWAAVSGMFWTVPRYLQALP